MRSWWMGLKVERLEFDSFSYVWSLGELCDWLRGVLCGLFCLGAPPPFFALFWRSIGAALGSPVQQPFRASRLQSWTPDRICFFSLQIGSF